MTHLEDHREDCDMEEEKKFQEDQLGDKYKTGTNKHIYIYNF